MPFALERLTLSPDDRADLPPLLFLHGAFGSARLWAPCFFPYFAERSFVCQAISLRGHGKSGGDARCATLGDYVEDLDRAVAQLDRPPILIGHSMGGIVVQAWLERHSAAGAVLLASVPPWGLSRIASRLILERPALAHALGVAQWGALPSGRGAQADIVLRSALLPPGMDEDQADAVMAEMGAESTLVGLQLCWYAGIHRRRVMRTPLAVVGVRGDAFIPDADVMETAEAYGVSAHFIEHSAHACMVGPGWRAAADVVAAAIDTLRVARPEAPERHGAGGTLHGEKVCA